MSSKLKQELLSSASLIKPPYLIVVANTRGGVGKTTTTLTIADLLLLNSIDVNPFQVDEQPQLAHLLGRRVVSLLPKLDNAKHARALSSPFSPLYSACEAAAQSNGVVLVDSGAGMVGLLSRWFRDVDLQEDLTLWKMRAVIIVPAVRESAAVEGAIETLSLLRQSLPEADLVFVENERDEPFSTVKPNTDLGAILRDRLPAALNGCRTIRMPAIEGEAWPSFEAAGLRFLKAIALSPTDIARILQEDVADAKIMRTFIVRYLRTMHREFAQIFDLPEGGA